ncbi:neuromedin-K receptor [Hydra vulgaris]|uniref:neuromedin-K receptor n=1 Tax=Hydra vulgaris TaxID=6087 RepID=UPI00064131D8|nr:neuromedin-K receptor [Hydra vulgaris]XP_047133549.1 neuromedin-K receptor [Hydra vulgaris]
MLNKSQNITFQSSSPFSNFENNATIMVYFILIALGLAINLVVIIIFYFKNEKKTKFCRFLLHLSFINIGQYIGIIPYLIIDTRCILSSYKYLESLICSISDGHSTMMVFSMASCVLLFFMSVLRCEVMIKPFRKLVNNKNLYKVFLVTWLFACISFIPYILSYKLDRVSGICFRSWIISNSFGIIYMSIMYICGLVLPILAMVFACVTSYIKLNSKHLKENSVQKKRKGVLIKLTCLIIIFTLTWFPYSVYWVMTYTTYVGNNIDKQLKRLKLLRYVLMPSLAGGIAGPFFNIYHWEPFRKSVQHLYNNCRHAHEEIQPIRFYLSTKIIFQIESETK